jgi:hypothetical protein
MFDHDYNNVRGFFVQEQLAALSKKYIPAGFNTSLLSNESYSAFVENNARMAAVNERLASVLPSKAPNSGYEWECIMWTARLLVHRVLGPLYIDELFEHAQHGAGSSIGVSFKDTSIEKKFSSKVSCTPRAASLFISSISYDFGLRDALRNYYKRPDGISVRDLDIVRGSRATTVDKTVSKRRMIAIEPTANMYLQQGLMYLMYSRLKEVGLDLGSLPYRHTQLAYYASVSGTSATIDFASASDCVSYELLRWILPPKWFALLDDVRSPEMEIGGDFLPLHMFSTMGNADTFPLETLVLWAIACACTQRSNGVKARLVYPDIFRAVSVFGDDCILPTFAVPSFMEAARSVGFIVNEAKSFFDNKPGFRESCGGDYLVGHDVRPFFLRAPINTRKSSLEPWLYTIMNGLFKKYIMYFGPVDWLYESELIELFRGIFARYNLRLKVVPSSFPDDSGLHVSVDAERICENYPFRLQPVLVDEHGLAYFSYCRFIYSETQKGSDDIRYQLDLRSRYLRSPQSHNPFVDRDSCVAYQYDRRRSFFRIIPKREKVNLFPVRRKGGYVVAKAFSFML